MVSKSWRCHTQRTPAGETVSPRLRNSLATRTWPKAGLNGERNNSVFNILRHTVLQHRFLAADLLQSQFAALVVELLEAIEAVAAVAHHLASLADVAELLGKLEQSYLGADNLLFSRHGVLQVAEAARCAPPTSSAPRLGS